MCSWQRQVRKNSMKDKCKYLDREAIVTDLAKGDLLKAESIIQHAIAEGRYRAATWLCVESPAARR